MCRYRWMAERYTPTTTQDHGIVFAQRIRVYSNGSNMQAGALLGTDGSLGYFCYADINSNTLRALRPPTYGNITTGSLTTIGRAIADNDILWFRAERRATTGTLQFKVWLDGNAEPTGWADETDGMWNVEEAEDCGEESAMFM